jgi:hypothetical protein
VNKKIWVKNEAAAKASEHKCVENKKEAFLIYPQ